MKTEQQRFCDEKRVYEGSNENLASEWKSEAKSVIWTSSHHFLESFTYCTCNGYFVDINLIGTRTLAYYCRSCYFSR